MKIKIADVGWKSVIISAHIAGILSFFAFFDMGVVRWYFFGAGCLFFLVSAFLAWFFRDPDRTPDSDDGAVSPADGVVTEARGHCDGTATVKIFMHLGNVHVNYSPFEGTITKVEHIKGGFEWAWSKDSDANERMIWTIFTLSGLVKVTQIAGMITRRIVPFKEAKDHVARGERIGIICFGSRVDLELPRGFKLTVKKDDKVLAGKTIIAQVIR